MRQPLPFNRPIFNVKTRTIFGWRAETEHNNKNVNWLPCFSNGVIRTYKDGRKPYCMDINYNEFISLPKHIGAFKDMSIFYVKANNLPPQF